MKKHPYMLNTLLAGVMGAALLAAILVRTFAPIIILPRPDIPALVLVSLAVLLLEHYLVRGAKPGYGHILLLSAATFGLLPWAACFVNLADAVGLAISGGIVFTVTAWLFTAIQERLASGPNYKAAPILSALGLYLASQGFIGMSL